MRLTPAILLVLVLVAGLIATACGDDDDGGDGDAAPAAAEGDPAGTTEDAGSAGSDAASGDGPEAAIERTVRDFLEAAATGDGKRACKLLSEEGRASVEEALTPDSGGPETCEEAFELIAEVAGGDSIQIGGEEVPASELDSLELSVKIAPDRRSAEVLADGNPPPATLVRESGEWKLNWD
ncbi:MAG TPA: hypothetical protein VK919_06745 [Solirubrobacterales bacterium]|nr:hypothetical protein [Solirubrobacterales bacterium]